MGGESPQDVNPSFCLSIKFLGIKHTRVAENHLQITNVAAFAKIVHSERVAQVHKVPIALIKPLALELADEY